MIQDMSFPHFRKNQVLTHCHLNEATGYSRQRIRQLQMVKGSGIFCGLIPSYVAEDSVDVVRLSKGAGSTTTGEGVLNREDQRYPYYQTFVLPDKTCKLNYLTDDDGTPFTLYELLKDNLDPKDSSKTNQNARKIGDAANPEPVGIGTDIRKDMAVILHLEIAEVDRTTCKIDSCDNMGFTKQLNWRALLISKTDLGTLFNKSRESSLWIEDYFRSKYRVHEVRIPIPRFDCAITQSYLQIYLNYLYVCTLGVMYLTETFEKSVTAYSRHVDDLEFKVKKLHDDLAHYRDPDNSRGIQYFYDHLNCVAMALNEFNDAAFIHHCDCSFNESRYPNYLMAGSFADPSERAFTDDAYRHYYEPCCLDLASTNRKKELDNLYKRLNVIIEAYDKTFLDKTSKTLSGERLFITAQSRLSGKLGDLTPPYYYKSDVLMRWNPDKFARGQSQDVPFYWTQARLNTTGWKQDFNSSLHFPLGKHDSYRIEGHLGESVEFFKEFFYGDYQGIGMHARRAGLGKKEFGPHENEIGLRRKYGLPFDVKFLEIRETDECEYTAPCACLGELRVLFEFERQEIVCFLERMFSFFCRFRIGPKLPDDTSGIESCKNELRALAGKIDEYIKMLHRDPRLPLTEKEIGVIYRKFDLACPVSSGEKPSYYIVRQETTGHERSSEGDAPFPFIMEYPGNHPDNLVNVLYKNGRIETFDVTMKEFHEMVRKYVKDDEQARERFLTVSIRKGGETRFDTPKARAAIKEKERAVIREAVAVSTIMGEFGGAGWLKPVIGGISTYESAVNYLTEQSREEKDPARKADYLGLRSVIQTTMRDSLPEELRGDFKYYSKVINRRGVILEVVEDQYNIVAGQRIKDRDLPSLFNILAGKISSLEEHISGDDIDEADDADSPLGLKAEIESLRDLTNEIIALLDDVDSVTAGEEEIGKCIILPMLISLSRLCWESQFLKIKTKYHEKKTSLLEKIILPQYLHGNPGAKPIAGSSIDGTFLIGYVRGSEVITESLRKQIEGSSLSAISDECDSMYDAYSRGRAISLKRATYWLSQYCSFTQTLRNFKVKSNRTGPTEIVVDLYVPYICCSDTSTVEYLVFAELKMDLPEVVCNHDEERRINHSPVAATITSDTIDLKKEKVDGYDVYSFNAHGMEATKHYAMISFGSRSATYSMQVIDHPVAEIRTPNEGPVWDEQRQKYIWTLTATIVRDDWSYKWYKRGLTDVQEEFDEVGDTATHEHESDKYEVVKFEIYLEVSNEASPICTERSETKLKEFQPEFDWDFKPKVFCEDTIHTITDIEPEGAELHCQINLENRTTWDPIHGWRFHVPNEVPEDCAITMTFGAYEPKPIPVTVLKRPKGGFTPGDPVLSEDNDKYELTLTADEREHHEHYSFKWYIGESTEGDPVEEGPVFILRWERSKGFNNTVTMVAINNECGPTCSSEPSRRSFDYDSETPQIHSPRVFCDNAGKQLIRFTPHDAVPDTTPTYVTVEGVGEDLKYWFDPTNQSGIKPVHIRQGDEDYRFDFEVLEAPEATYTSEQKVDDERKLNYMLFTAPNVVDHIYTWEAFEEGRPDVIPEGEGNTFRIDGHPNKQRTFSLQLTVSGRSCAQRVPSGTCQSSSEPHTFHIEPYNWSIEPRDFCNGSDVSVPLSITPEGAELIVDARLKHHVVGNPDVGYEFKPFRVTQDEYPATIILGHFEPRNASIIVVRQPKATFRPGDRVLQDDTYELTLRATDSDYAQNQHEWFTRLGPGGEPIGEPASKTPTLTLTWNRYTPLTQAVLLRVRNTYKGITCEDVKKDEIAYEADEVPPELKIDFPRYVCNNNGLVPIGYSPVGRGEKLSGEEGSSYVTHDVNNNRAHFKTDGLPPRTSGQSYPIFIRLGGVEHRHDVEVWPRPPVPEYGYDPADGIIYFAVRNHLNLDEYTYRWYITEEDDKTAAGTGTRTEVTGYPDRVRTFYMTLCVSNNKCSELTGRCETCTPLGERPFIIKPTDVGPVIAHDPTPADGAELVDSNATLSWTPGFGAAMHTVYFGDNFDEVSNATEGSDQATATYTPGPLEPDMVYYWRVDEVEADGAVHRGNVWSFSTGPSSPGALVPTPADGSIHGNTWIALSWTPGDSAVSYDAYFGETFEGVESGAGDTFLGNLAGANLLFRVGLPGLPYPDGLVPGTTYYWRIDQVNDADPNSPWRGEVWSFTVQPRIAHNPEPADGAKSVDANVVLRWGPGLGAKLHTVYFGDNLDEVSNATGGALQTTVTYTPPGPLNPGKVYYWRVDESTDRANWLRGDVWSFAVASRSGPGVIDREAIDRLRSDLGELEPELAHGTFMGHDLSSAEVETINNNNVALFETVLADQAPDVNPADMPEVTTMIRDNVLALTSTVDNLPGEIFDSTEDTAVRRYFRLNLLVISELLLARSTDMRANSRIYRYVTAMAERVQTRFKISDATASKRELIGRAPRRANTRSLLFVAERI